MSGAARTTTLIAPAGATSALVLAGCGSTSGPAGDTNPAFEHAVAVCQGLRR